MRDDFTQNRSDKLVEYINAFETRLKRQHPRQINAIPFVDSAQFTGCPKGHAGEYATKFANIINNLTNHLDRLRAWDKLISELDNDEKYAVSHEFLNTSGWGRAWPILCDQITLCQRLPASVPSGKPGMANKSLAGGLFRRTSTSTIFNLMALVGVRTDAVGGPPLRLPLLTSENHGISSRFILGITGTVRRAVK